MDLFETSCLKINVIVKKAVTILLWPSLSLYIYKYIYMMLDTIKNGQSIFAKLVMLINVTQNQQLFVSFIRFFYNLSVIWDAIKVETKSTCFLGPVWFSDIWCDIQPLGFTVLVSRSWSLSNCEEPFHQAGNRLLWFIC